MPKKGAKKSPSKKTGKTTKTKKSPTRAREEIFEERMGHFGQEMQSLGERWSRKGEEWGKRWEKRDQQCDGWFHRTFGLVGPLISSIVGLLILGVVIWAVNFMAAATGVVFFYNVNAFLIANMGFLFLLFLFFSYTSYLSKAYRRAYRPFSPVTTALGITIAFWVFMEALVIANISLGIPLLSQIAFHIGRSFFWIFLLFLFLGYVVLLARTAYEQPMARRERISMRKPRPVEAKQGPHRLYRSGNDRILGGVCGGIGEYLGIDPVIIRLLWVLFSLLYGYCILFYVIAWIIIPRNPGHRWDR